MKRIPNEATYSESPYRLHESGPATKLVAARQAAARAEVGARVLGAEQELETLERVLLVVADKEIEGPIRAARAEVARLSLELRALQHEAALAEGPSGMDPTADTLRSPAAGEPLRTGLDAYLAARRSELIAEVNQARLAAARRILTAQTEAAALVAEARDELLQVLSEASNRALAAPPRHRLVTGLVCPAEPGPTGASSAERSTDGCEPVPSADAGSSSPAPPSAPPAVPAQPAQPAQPAPLAPPPPSAARPPVPTATQRPTDRDRARSLRSRFLHADVLLPLIAVLIVFIVLVAWLA